MPRLPSLETARLRLRPFSRGDAQWLALMLADPEVKCLTLEPALPQAQARLVARAQAWLHSRRGYWAILFEGEPCGFVCLVITSSLGPPGVYLGFELRREFWGRGFATEAAQAVVEFAGGHFGLGAAHAAVLEQNEASMRVLDKAGFQRGGPVILPGAKPGFWYWRTLDAGGGSAAPPGLIGWWRRWRLR